MPPSPTARAARTAQDVFDHFAFSPHRATALAAVASALDTARDQLITLTADETALTPAELEPEFARTVDTLRLFADLVRAEDQPHSWRRSTSDPASPPDQPPIGPNHPLRAQLEPLGPVAVFGASNFPLAYGVCGGDTASALAAGCPVIVKEHPAHPRTGARIASLARNALADANLSPDLLQYIPNPDPADFAPAQALVSHPLIRAIGFTGSTRAGLALTKLASNRTHPRTHLPDPIPVFAEMGSCNPILILPRALDARLNQIADDIAASLLARVGQQCTAPGVVLVLSPNNPADALARATRLYHALAARCAPSASALTPRRMLAPNIATNYYARLDSALATGLIALHTPIPAANARERTQSLAQPAILLASPTAITREPTLREEIFGPALIVAPITSLTDLALWPGSLTATVIADDADDSADDNNNEPTRTNALRCAARIAGRVILNGVPTGVRVCASTVHSGPYPSSNAQATTAVGPRAIERWCRPVCYQNA